MVLIAEILFEEGFPLRFGIPKESPEERELTFLSSDKNDVGFGTK